MNRFEGIGCREGEYHFDTLIILLPENALFPSVCPSFAKNGSGILQSDDNQ